MASAPAHRTLIVANRTAATALLLEEVARRAQSNSPRRSSCLIPDVSSRTAADWTLSEGLRAIRGAASGPTGHRQADVEGLLGGPDAFESIKQTLADGHFDDVIISTLAKRRSEWLRRDSLPDVSSSSAFRSAWSPSRPRSAWASRTSRSRKPARDSCA